MTSPKKIRVLTQEDAKNMDCPFPPETGYEDIELKKVGDIDKPNKVSAEQIRLPKGVQVIQVGDSVVFARYFMGRWKPLSADEQRRLIEQL